MFCAMVLTSLPVNFPSVRDGFWNSKKERMKNMPLIKKAPGMVTLEVRIEEPVKELLEDYARFIDSTPDHVVNTVVKKNLWRDQDYRKWREERRAEEREAAKGTGLPEE